MYGQRDHAAILPFLAGFLYFLAGFFFFAVFPAANAPSELTIAAIAVIVRSCRTHTGHVVVRPDTERPNDRTRHTGHLAESLAHGRSAPTGHVIVWHTGRNRQKRGRCPVPRVPARAWWCPGVRSERDWPDDGLVEELDE